MYPEIYSYTDWKTDTDLLGQFRSDELKALDKAIKEYTAAKSKGNYEEVQTKFYSWKKFNGGSAKKGDQFVWETNPRNFCKAFTILDRQLLQKYPEPIAVVEQDLSGARLGIVYFLSVLKPEESYKKLAKDVKDSFSDGAEDSGDSGNKPSLSSIGSLKMPSIGPINVPSVGSIISPEQRKKVEELWRAMMDQVRIDFKVPDIDLGIKLAFDFVFPEVLKQIAGVLSDCKDVITGTVKAIQKFRQEARLKELLEGVAVLDSHPSVMATRILELINNSAWDSAKGAAKSAAAFGITALTGGISKIATAIGGAIYAVYKFIKRWLELRKIKEIVKKAEEYYEAKSIHNDKDKFTEWLTDLTEKVPILAALILNCGIAGDVSSFMELYPLTDSPVSSMANAKTHGAYDRGVAAHQKLKETASKLIREYEIKFSSEEPYLISKIKHAGEIDLVASEASSGLKACLFTIAQSTTIGKKVVAKVTETSTPMGTFQPPLPKQRSRGGTVLSPPPSLGNG